MNSPSSVAPARGLSLYELGEQWQALEAALVESGGELTPEVEAAFAALGAIESHKVDSYAAVVRSFSAYLEAVKAEEAELRTKRKVAEAAIERLKGRLLDYMRERGVRELRGTTWRAAIQRNGGLRPMSLLVAAEELPPAFQKITVEADWPAIRAALADLAIPPDVGAQVATPGAVGPDVDVHPVGEHLRIK